MAALDTVKEGREELVWSAQSLGFPVRLVEVIQQTRKVEASQDNDELGQVIAELEGFLTEWTLW